MEFKLEFDENGDFEMELNGVICDKEYDLVLKKWTVIYPDHSIDLI